MTDMQDMHDMTGGAGPSPEHRESMFSSPRFIRATIVVFIAGIVLAAVGFAMEVLSRKP